MGRQWNTIIESLGPLSGGTMSINANLTEIEALLTTLQADVADGITVSSGTVTANVPLNEDTWAGNEGIRVVGNGSDGALRIGGYDPNTGIHSNLEEGGGIPIFVCASGGGTQSLPVSGTVTAEPTRGTTTTGTLTAGTTNGTLFATNSTRNYLLVQCTSGTVFIDTDGTATAANGIQLTSGQGITFEGSFIPTGAIAAITSTGTAQLIGRQG
jgi:hypothetical protein